MSLLLTAQWHFTLKNWPVAIVRIGKSETLKTQKKIILGLIILQSNETKCFDSIFLEISWKVPWKLRFALASFVTYTRPVFCSSSRVSADRILLKGTCWNLSGSPRTCCLVVWVDYSYDTKVSDASFSFTMGHFLVKISHCLTHTRRYKKNIHKLLCIYSERYKEDAHAYENDCFLFYKL